MNDLHLVLSAQTAAHSVGHPAQRPDAREIDTAIEKLGIARQFGGSNATRPCSRAL